MHIKNIPLKTLGRRSAGLVAELYERHRPTFTLQDVQEIAGLTPEAARKFIHKLHRRGIVTRLKSGLYNLVPFELGRATHHVGDPYSIAREVVGNAPYFLSHATAFELHRMATHPSLEIYVSSPKRFRSQTVGGYRYRFVLVPPARFFGATRYWVTKEQSVAISDLERTVLDGLRQPEYAGGVVEVAKGLWMQRERLNIGRLIEYAVRLHVGAVLCRVGFLLERYALANEAALKPLRAHLPGAYHRLDPLLPAEGPRLARWRLQLNVPPEELDAVRFG